MRLNYKIIQSVLVVMGGIMIALFYINEIDLYMKSNKIRYEKKQLELQKSSSDIVMQHSLNLCRLKYTHLDKNIEDELQKKLANTYDGVLYIYNKYKNIKNKNQIKEKIIDFLTLTNLSGEKISVFLGDFDGNIILSKQRRSASYTDADGRSIVLEEVQTVRKRGIGYIKSRDFNLGKNEEILVKKLGIYNWFIGYSIYKDDKIDELKNSLLKTLCSNSKQDLNFITIYEKDKNLCTALKTNKVFKPILSKTDIWHEDENGMFYIVKYYKPLDWHVVFGFKALKISDKHYEDLEKSIDKKIVDMMKFFILFVIFVIIFFNRRKK